MNATVSIIIRAFNAERYLHEALKSIVNQDYKEGIEALILFDKGSKTTDALKIAHEFKREYEDTNVVFRIVEHDHMSPFRALHLGLEEAMGKYVGFLDYDNIYKENFISECVKVLDKGVDATFVFATAVDNKLKPIDTSSTLPLSLRIFRSFINKPPLNRFVDHPPSKLDVRKLLVVNYVDISSLMINERCRDILLDAFSKLTHRYFDWIYEDWLSALVLAKEGVKSKRVDGTTYYYRIHEENITATADPKKDLPKVLMHLEREAKTLKAFQYLYGSRLSPVERLILTGMLSRKLFRYFTES